MERIGRYSLIEPLGEGDLAEIGGDLPVGMLKANRGLDEGDDLCGGPLRLGEERERDQGDRQDAHSKRTRQHTRPLPHLVLGRGGGGFDTGRETGD